VFPLSKPDSKLSVTHGDDPQKSIHLDFVTGLNQDCRIRNTGNARQSVFACDNSTMNQHPAPALDNCRGKRYNKRDVGIHASQTNTSPCLKSAKSECLRMTLALPLDIPGPAGWPISCLALIVYPSSFSIGFDLRASP
jgi:hypothetical protein